MEARFRHWIKNKKVIASFYLTILTFFLIIAWYELAILTLFYVKSYISVFNHSKLDFNSQLRVYIS